MRIAIQLAFCTAHQRTSVRAAYATSGYPAINLSNSSLITRIECLHPELLRIVHGEQTMIFRNVLETETAQGGGRTLLAKAMHDGLQVIRVGYYEPRGREVMERWVATQLAGDIREVAGVNRLVRYKTVGRFV